MKYIILEEYEQGELKKSAEASTILTGDTETTIFDPTREFLKVLYLVYLLYCYFTQ